MNQILKKITARLLTEERQTFNSFSPKSFKLKPRPSPIDILPLLQADFFIIAECKKGSPSRGIICEDYRPVQIALQYQQAGASAVSVITEEFFFHGSRSHLEAVKNEVRLPVLRKDFIIHPFQVYESYNLGADFILLIAACLEDDELKRLYDITLSLGMQALIEVHDAPELERVLRLNPPIIGINNRDLNTFQVDLNTSFSLKKQIPNHIHVISESGIHSPNQIESLKTTGFAGALIGESLMKSSNPFKKLKKIASGGQGALLKNRPLDPHKTFDLDKYKIFGGPGTFL